MRVLIACEFSGVVRDAFRARGFDAVSCDLMASEVVGPHLQCDVREVLDDPWDLMIAFPPCTHLAISGARWFPQKDDRQMQALYFVQALLDAPIPRIALENPIGILSTVIRKPDQIIQPWMFGHDATKSTCLWLKDLPLLTPTAIVSRGKRHVTSSGKSLPDWYNMPPSPWRAAARSRMFKGVAVAMADQWGSLIDDELSFLGGYG